MRRPRFLDWLLAGLLVLTATGCELKPTMATLQVQTRAPRFRLDSTHGVLDLEKGLAQGPVVLVFYRGHWCPICRRQLTEIQSRLTEVVDRGTSLWAISVDDIKDSREQLQEKLSLGFPLASDPDLRVIRSYGVEMSGKSIAIPATFVLRAGDGEVVYRYVGKTLFDRPPMDDILHAIERARLVGAPAPDQVPSLPPPPTREP